MLSHLSQPKDGATVSQKTPGLLPEQGRKGTSGRLLIRTAQPIVSLIILRTPDGAHAELTTR